MDSVISGLQAKLQTLKSSNEDNPQPKAATQEGQFKNALNKFSHENSVMTEKPPKKVEQEPDDDIKVVNGKEEFSIRFDKDDGKSKNISCSSSQGGDEIAQRIKGKLTMLHQSNSDKEVPSGKQKPEPEVELKIESYDKEKYAYIDGMQKNVAERSPIKGELEAIVAQRLKPVIGVTKEDFSQGNTEPTEAVKEEKCQNHEPPDEVSDSQPTAAAIRASSKGPRPSILIGTFNESSTDYNQIVKKLN